VQEAWCVHRASASRGSRDYHTLELIVWVPFAARCRKLKNMHLRVNYYVYFVNIGQMAQEYTYGWASQARDTLDVHMQKGLDARIIPIPS
jgi:hypothetical protein